MFWILCRCTECCMVVSQRLVGFLQCWQHHHHLECSQISRQVKPSEAIYACWHHVNELIAMKVNTIIIHEMINYSLIINITSSQQQLIVLKFYRLRLLILVIRNFWDFQDEVLFIEQVTVLRGHTGMIKGVTWDPVGSYLASQSDDKTVRVWRTYDWQLESCIKEPFKEVWPFDVSNCL